MSTVIKGFLYSYYIPMEGLILMLSIIAAPVVMFVTEWTKKKRNMEGRVAIAIVSLLVAVIYVAITIIAPSGTIDAAITYAGTTSSVSMLLYNFLKPFLEDGRA